MTGIVMAFDKHWNIALSDVFEVWKRRKTNLCSTSDFGKPGDSSIFGLYQNQKLVEHFHRLRRGLYCSTSTTARQAARGASEIIESKASRMLQTLGPGAGPR